MNLLQQLHDKLEEKDFATLATLARQVWYRRNLMVFDSPQALITQTDVAFALYKQVNERELYLGGSVLPEGRGPDAHGLKKPPLDFANLNWDASLDTNSKRMGVRGLIKDSGGNVLAAISSSIPLVQDLEVAEAVAAWRNLSFCCEQGFQKIILEGDSLNVIKALQREEGCWSKYGQIIKDMQALIRTLQCCEANHIRREANGVTHRLVRNALLFLEDKVKMMEVPSFIQSNVLSEQDLSI